jgi:hypothetical protein
MITQNFHIFVIVATIAVYIILKSYKTSDDDNSNKSNLIYVLLTPLILYGGNYFLTNDTELISNNQSINSSTSEELLSMPYPISSDSSF